MACSGVSREMGGSTPKASAVRKIMWLGMAADAGQHGIIDELERVGGTRVFGDFLGVEIESAGLRLHSDVLEHRAETDGVPDLRLLLARKTDALGVTAALEVEDTAMAPAVLVVTDEETVGVGRERGLAGAGEPEE